MKNLYALSLLLSCISIYSTVPVQKENKENLDMKQTQEKEYYRYLTQVISELEKDPVFNEKIKNVTEEDIVSGKIAHLYDLVGHKVRGKLDEIKRMEVEYQRELIRQRKHHMLDKNVNYWNPVHHDNKITFEKEDFSKLLEKHSLMLTEETQKSHEEFKIYEMEKEHKRREAMKNMTAEEKVIAEKKHKASLNKQHERLHEPGHKAQLQEVWEKEDGLDPESFDPKTFFNLHDKNGDGYLDQFELETILLHDLEKAYNDSDLETDLKERDEEMVLMREYMMAQIDIDKDGLLSMKEFINDVKSESFESDKEWKPLREKEMFTKEEFEAYEHRLDKTGDMTDHQENKV